MEIIIHYSRDGYNGDFTYDSVCGKKIKTHQEDESVSIHPEQTSCLDCKETVIYRADIQVLHMDLADIKRRIYIESDILHADEFAAARRAVARFCKAKGVEYVGRVFSDVLDFAWHDLEKTWEAVKLADEIYAISSLIPMGGGNGAPTIFNEMCNRAVAEKVEGKSVIILNEFKHVEWYYIDMKVMKKAFKKNSLYMYNDEHELVKVDIAKIK